MVIWTASGFKVILDNHYRIIFGPKIAKNWQFQVQNIIFCLENATRDSRTALSSAQSVRIGPGPVGPKSQIFRWSRISIVFDRKWLIFETKKDLWPKLQVNCWTSLQSSSSNQKRNPDQAWCIWYWFCLSLLSNRISTTENGFLWGWSEFDVDRILFYRSTYTRR